MKIKKWGVAVILYLVVFAVVAAVQEYAWHNYTKPTKQHVIANSKVSALKKAAEKNIVSYQGWQVPYNYRLAYYSGFQISWRGGNKYRFTYIFDNQGNNKKLAPSLDRTYFDDSLAINQNFYVYHHKNHWLIQNKAKQKSLTNSNASDSSKSAKRNTNIAVKLPTNTTKTRAMKYFTENQKLYVTYDNKKDKVLVPNGYRQVFITPNNSYDETLNSGSYIITPEFTAFVAYRKKSTGILYSLDKGKHWTYSKLKYKGFRAKAFISKTDDRVYVTYATDEALGTDYYATLYTSDMQTWSNASFPKSLDQSNVTLVYWDNDNLVYYASKLGGFKFSDDGGENMRPVTLDFPDDIENIKGGNPFTVPSAMYTYKGKIYLIMQQGENGDYAKNNKLMEAVMEESLDLASFDYKKQQAAK
ncbi:glycoside hydrolase [Ligilactobacillus sp. WILCCON 0076]|uniref:Glycoside hydrolase n=1 Tax=Ligilactobacillus ubinensis TaxID=2876789 RepID=A0A9X2JL19_9LACO|nr:sialidase family protein [Ligilactobacillus ubinensis]MCP0886617.1 glycoside hydrolase [Ligilactobacillus ubinensis]